MSSLVRIEVISEIDVQLLQWYRRWRLNYHVHVLLLFIGVVLLDIVQYIYVDNIFVFFFQAEDGIRDCLLSRGLGDVYKRQDYPGI